MDFGNDAKLISALCRARRDGAPASRVGGSRAELVQHHGQRPAALPAPRPARAARSGRPDPRDLRWNPASCSSELRGLGQGS